jgi:alpha-N-acetylglucosamine transferase
MLKGIQFIVRLSLKVKIILIVDELVLIDVTVELELFAKLTMKLYIFYI